MKKIIEKDKKLREHVILKEHAQFICKSITKNFNFFTLIRWNAYLKLNEAMLHASKISVTKRCLFTINRKAFNKFTAGSRHVFLKQIRGGYIPGIKKSSW